MLKEIRTAPAMQDIFEQLLRHEIEGLRKEGGCSSSRWPSLSRSPGAISMDGSGTIGPVWSSSCPVTMQSRHPRSPPPCRPRMVETTMTMIGTTIPDSPRGSRPPR
jgi:hypothetical protein